MKAKVNVLDQTVGGDEQTPRLAGGDQDCCIVPHP